jgi:RNA polymerase sigma-70 factor (ECF subfamily)
VEHRTTAYHKLQEEITLTVRFLECPDDASFTGVFRTFTPQLLAFYRARGCEGGLAEDLAQEVMLTVYRKAGELRDRAAFRAWVFRIAKNALCQHYGKCAREVNTVDVGDGLERLAAVNTEAATPAFEFMAWMSLLDSSERDAMRLRFIEQWEYHEIAAEKSIPIGTVQWRVFNAKKKLAPHLAGYRHRLRNAA